MLTWTDIMKQCDFMLQTASIYADDFASVSVMTISHYPLIIPQGYIHGYHGIRAQWDRVNYDIL